VDLTPALVERLVVRLFPPESSAAASALLARYGTESYEKEVVRVRVAALKLCDGSLERLEGAVVAAKRDYRDVLAWAEYPDEMRRPTWRLPAEEQSRIQQSDRMQYQAWLAEHGE
jgi:hypothetical protein